MINGYLKIPTKVEEDTERREALLAACRLLAPYSADRPGSPTRDGLVFLNAATNEHAARFFALQEEQAQHAAA